MKREKREMHGRMKRESIARDRGEFITIAIITTTGVFSCLVELQPGAADNVYDVRLRRDWFSYCTTTIPHAYSSQIIYASDNICLTFSLSLLLAVCPICWQSIVFRFKYCHPLQVLFDCALFSVYYHACMYHLNLLCHLLNYQCLWIPLQKGLSYVMAASTNMLC